MGASRTRRIVTLALLAPLTIAAGSAAGTARASDRTTQTFAYVANPKGCVAECPTIGPAASQGRVTVIPNGTSVSLFIDEAGLAESIEVTAIGWWHTVDGTGQQTYERGGRHYCVPARSDFTIDRLLAGSELTVWLHGGSFWLYPGACHDARLANPWNARAGTVTISY